MIAIQNPHVGKPEGFFKKETQSKFIILKFLKGMQQFNSIRQYFPYFIYERTNRKTKSQVTFPSLFSRALQSWKWDTCLLPVLFSSILNTSKNNKCTQLRCFKCSPSEKHTILKLVFFFKYPGGGGTYFSDQNLKCKVQSMCLTFWLDGFRLSQACSRADGHATQSFPLIGCFHEETICQKPAIATVALEMILNPDQHRPLLTEAGGYSASAFPVEAVSIFLG